MKIYDETQTSAQELLDEGIWNTLTKWDRESMKLRESKAWNQ
jgi:hypothetical protein